MSVATSEQTKDIKYMIEKQTKEKMSDGHLWFSVLARPTTSSFARSDRLTCAYVLLCITMLMNIMYYEKDTSTPNQNELIIGPLSFSQSQVNH